MAAESPQVEIGVFDDLEQARRAILALNRAGFDAQQVSILAADPEDAERVAHATRSDTPADAGGRASDFLAWVAGAADVVVPGVGPAISPSTLGPAYTSATAGDGRGAITGVLVGMGLSANEATHCESAVEAGRVLVAVRASDHREAIRAILDSARSAPDPATPVSNAPIHAPPSPAPAPPDVSGASSSAIEPGPLAQPGTAADPAVARERAHHLRPGLQVVASDGVDVGRVKEVGDVDFVVSRGLLHGDTVVPLTAIQEIGQNRAVLNVPIGQVDAQGWSSP